MPISVLQHGSGGFTTTGAQTVALPAASTTGNVVVMFVATVGQTVTATGWTNDSPTNTGTSRCYVYRRVSAGETSWSISVGIATQVRWTVLELEGADSSAPLDVSAIAAANTANTTVTGGTTTRTTTYDGLAFAAHVGNNTASTTAATYSAQTGGFTELTEGGQAGTTNNISMAISTRDLLTLGTQQSSATASVSVASHVGVVIVYSAADAPRAADIAVCTGFEYGTTAGLTTATLGFGLFDASAGSPAITTGSARNGTYGLELSAAAAAETVTWQSGGAMATTPPSAFNTVVVRVSFRFPASLPAGDVELLAVETLSGNAVVWFRTGGDQIGVKISTGTEQLAAGAVVADTWYSIDLRLRAATTAYTVDWQFDGVAQTQATFTAGAASTSASVRIGWTTAATATVHYDDVVVSKIAGHYPLGDYKVTGLTVDPAGTVTVSGTAANFATFASNGTITAWNATTARNAVDELPPTIGASADGLVQQTTLATDYVALPMATTTAAPTHSIQGVRVLACGWAASATAATIAFRAFDGTTEYGLMSGAGTAAVDTGFDNSTTTPAWWCRMVRPVGSTSVAPVWTQTMLDALAVRVGFSGNATVDIGVHAVYAEVALAAGRSIQMHYLEDGAFTVDALLDPLSDAVVGYTVTNSDPTRGVSVTRTIGGTPTTDVIAAGASLTVTVAGIDVTTLQNLDVQPDPLPA